MSSSASLAADVASVEVDEGSEASNTGTWSAPDDHPVELSALPGTLVQNANGTWSWTFAAKDGPSESQAVTVTAADANGGTDSCSFGLTVNNVAPSCGPITLATPVELGDSALLEASFTDPGVRDTHSATWDWGDGSALTAGSITEVGGNGAVTDSHSYAEAGELHSQPNGHQQGRRQLYLQRRVRRWKTRHRLRSVLPSSITAEATSGSGATVDFTATALDAVDGDVPVGCTPASGSVFPLGTTRVQLHNLRFGRQQLERQLRRHGARIRPRR